ncbi:MAG TPA: S-methyl-5-thioribose-1-phosphate isomerase [Candidatus Lokiarchaeia archaeon]|nr:S-methyl-5-thioribose-1-phosphate isomerase [Candidatus Lokiarchaeia archaeon]
MLERTIEWMDEEACAKLIDQTKLPLEHATLVVKTCARMAQAIKVMEIRGAPAIGAAAAMGMALAALEFKGSSKRDLIKHLEKAKVTLDSTRPTAVNLFWGTKRILDKAKEIDMPVNVIVEELVTEAKLVAEEDVEKNKQMGKNGAVLLEDGDTVLTHCNAGALACVAYGTALGVIRAAVESGKSINVISDETRPRLQGATLTCWELQQDNIPVTQIADTEAGLLMSMGKINKIVVGADRITSDAVFNKIGTYQVAIMAKYHGIPFYVAAPVSTIDLDRKMKDVEIEQRDEWEVKTIFKKVQISPDGVPALNYAFDPTPMELVTAIITEDGVFTPAQLLERYPFVK